MLLEIGSIPERFMNKILTIQQAIEVSNKLKAGGKSIVLAGGCFDVLHIGHIDFLNEAKKRGDILFVLLESDEIIRKIKGNNRPINTQVDRARILSALLSVDYVIILPQFTKDKEYDDIVTRIKPDIIATTEGDKNREHKERQARLIGARVVDVVKNISNKSTTKLIKLLSEDYL